MRQTCQRRWLGFPSDMYCLWWLRGRLRLCLFLDQPPPLLLKTVQFHYGLPCYRAVSGSRPWFLNKLLRTSGGPLRLERRQLSETVFRKTDIFKNRLCCSDTRRPVEANVGYITDESAHFWSAQQSPRQCVLLLLRAALQHRLIRGDRTRLLVLLQSRQVLVGVKMPPDIATCPCPTGVDQVTQETPKVASGVSWWNEVTLKSDLRSGCANYGF